MTKSFTPLMDLNQRRLAYEAVLARCDDALPDAAHLSDLVHRKLGWEALWAACRAYDRGRTLQTPVDELVAFAFDCWPQVRGLPAYWALQVRRRIGPRTMPYLQPFVLSAFAHKAETWWWRRSWKIRGI